MSQGARLVPFVVLIALLLAAAPVHALEPAALAACACPYGDVARRGTIDVRCAYDVVTDAAGRPARIQRRRADAPGVDKVEVALRPGDIEACVRSWTLAPKSAYVVGVRCGTWRGEWIDVCRDARCLRVAFAGERDVAALGEAAAPDGERPELFVIAAQPVTEAARRARFTLTLVHRLRTDRDGRVVEAVPVQRDPALAGTVVDLAALEAALRSWRLEPDRAYTARQGFGFAEDALEVCPQKPRGPCISIDLAPGAPPS